MDIFFRNQIIENIEHIGTSPERLLKVVEVAGKQNEWDPFYQPLFTMLDEEILKLCEQTIVEAERMQQELW